MNSKNLSRRLERLEAEMAPPEERVVPFMVTYIQDGGELEWKLSEMRTPIVNGRLRPSEGRWVAIGSGRGRGDEYMAALKHPGSEDGRGITDATNDRSYASAIGWTRNRRNHDRW
jgi:hypothetical protein